MASAPVKKSSRALSILGLAASTMTRDTAHSKKEIEYFWEQDNLLLQKLLSECGNGSMIRGWRLELDPDGHLQVSFADFCRFARKSAYVGDASALVGRDGDFRYLSLFELSPRKHDIVTDFQHFVSVTFDEEAELPGDYTHQRFVAACDKDGSGKINYASFVQGSREHGCTMTDEELSLVYDCIDYVERGYFTEEDAIFLEEDDILRDSALLRASSGQMRAWKQVMAQEYLDSKTGQNKDSFGQQRSPAHRLAPRAWHAQTFENLPHVLCKRQYERTMEKHRRMRDARLTFLEHYRSTYGSAARLFRRGLDPNGTFGVEPVRLRKYCRQKNLELSPFDLWNALDMDGDGVISLEELNMQDAILLAHFLKWARDTKGSCVDLWECPEAASLRKAQQEKGAWVSHKKMQSKVFVELMEQLGWPLAKDSGAQARLLTALDIHGSDLIMRSDLEWLDKWRPPEWLSAAPDKEAWLELKELLLHRYGHLLIAWRALLCKDKDSALLSWKEFNLACIKVAFEGNIPGAWRTLDVDISGTITIHEFEPESARLLFDFKDWCDMNFGSVTHFFKAMDAEKHGSVKYPEMKRVCAKFKFQGEVRRLFQCLCSDQRTAMARRSLILEEVAFLDKWEVPPTDEQLDGRFALDSRRTLLRKAVQKKSSALTKAVSAMTLMTLRSAGIESIEEENLGEDTGKKEWDVRPQTGSRPASSSSTTVAEGLSRPVSRQQEESAVVALLPTISRSTTPATAGTTGGIVCGGATDVSSPSIPPFPFFAPGGAQPCSWGSRQCHGNKASNAEKFDLGATSRPQSENTPQFWGRPGSQQGPGVRGRIPEGRPATVGYSDYRTSASDSPTPPRPGSSGKRRSVPPSALEWLQLVELIDLQHGRARHSDVSLLTDSIVSTSAAYSTALTSQMSKLSQNSSKPSPYGLMPAELRKRRAGRRVMTSMRGSDAAKQQRRAADVRKGA
mmetsp:Transcript_24657/g.56923  ORF Transcript_24657/g.56923 Transcript_24657/m.56923 type:complete len:961 (-) Transcript_24657:105-2987(-)